MKHLRRVDRRYPISWGALAQQFGADIKDAWRFRATFAADLAAIRGVLPALPIEVSEQGVWLSPCDSEHACAVKGVRLVARG